MKISKKFTKEDVFNFFKENLFLSQYSGRRRYVSKRKQKNFFRKIFSSSDLFASFEIDLLYVLKKRKLNYYFFVMLDLTSRYLLFTKLKHRSATNITFGMSKILKQIREYKGSISSINNPDEKMIFFSDKGKVFIFFVSFDRSSL